LLIVGYLRPLHILGKISWCIWFLQFFSQKIRFFAKYRHFGRLLA